MGTHDPGEIEFVLQAAQDSDVKSSGSGSPISWAISRDLPSARTI